MSAYFLLEKADEELLLLDVVEARRAVFAVVDEVVLVFFRQDPSVEKLVKYNVHAVAVGDTSQRRGKRSRQVGCSSGSFHERNGNRVLAWG